jgi:16S rRNA (cytosine967-C5)-methyltransferase
MGKSTSARSLAHQALLRIETEGAYSDIVLSHLMDHSPLDERDRAFVSELVRGVIRWKKYLDWMVSCLFKGDLEKMPTDVRLLLWQAFYQIVIIKTPPFAAVNECIRLIKERRHYAWSGVANGILRTFLRNPQAVQLPDEVTSPIEYLAVKASHPEWMVARWIEQFGKEATQRLCEANNSVPLLSVRCNTGKNSFDDFCRLLDKEGADYKRSQVPGFVRINSMKETVRRRLLEDGLMTVQDESAGLVGLLCAPENGRVIVDLCAAPGGKSTHLAEQAPSSVVISGDIHRRRANLIVAAKTRLGQSNLHVVVADADFFPVKQADLVLLDAPCSGLGVLRRKPEIRWKRQPSDILKLAERQKKMIRRAAELVAPGGFLLYSTCTLEREENEAVIDDFIAHSNFALTAVDEQKIPAAFITADGMLRTFPHLHGMDGAFAVKLKKRN